MKNLRLFRTACAGMMLCFLFFVCAAHSQGRSQNRPPVSAPSLSSHPSADEKLLLDAANRERTAAGLQALKWDDALAAAAREHARLMAGENVLSHQLPGEPPLDHRVAQAGAKYAMIAENVAIGPNPEAIHDGWMHSPGHRRNILNAELTAIGIATTRGNGGLFAVQDFSRKVADLSLEQQEEKVASLLRGTDLLAVDATADARKTCSMDRDYAGTSVLYIIRFEVTDLSKLPDELLQKIKSRKYRKGAVGACQRGDAGGFTRYRIAVLLY
ncbi:MAG TPA: CAP domain-containing protein [Candidatus Acidoferrum sp.]